MPSRRSELQPKGVDDLVEVLAQLLHREIATDLNVAEEPEPGVPRRPLVAADDALDALVVRSHSVTNQAVRHGHALEHVDAQMHALLLEESVGSVETGRPRADDGYAEGALGAAEGKVCAGPHRDLSADSHAAPTA